MPGVPIYVRATPGEWSAAKAAYARLQSDPAWAMQARFRTAAVASQMANGRWIDPLLALEFKTLIESRQYRPKEFVPPERLSGDVLDVAGWKSDLPVPTAAPINPFGWLDDVAARL